MTEGAPAMTSPRGLVGVFDAGIGGIPVAAALKSDGHHVVYLADSARRPYGPQPHEAVTQYVAEAERFFTDAGCNAWVIACNTASVVADQAIDDLIPCVTMLSAVADEFPASGAGRLGLLGTAGTVASGAFPRALSTYEIHQVATEELLRIAEEGGGDAAKVRELAAAAFRELRVHDCQDVILACTDFTCVLDDLIVAAEGLRLVDPMHAAVRLIQETVAATSPPGGSDVEDRLVMTGVHPVDIRAYARDRFHLDLPEAEYRQLGLAAEASSDV